MPLQVKFISGMSRMAGPRRRPTADTSLSLSGNPLEQYEPVEFPFQYARRGHDFLIFFTQGRPRPTVMSLLLANWPQLRAE